MERKGDLIESIKRRAYGGDILDASVDDRDIEFFINDSVRTLCSNYYKSTGKSIAGEFEVEYPDIVVETDQFGRPFCTLTVLPLTVVQSQPLRSVRPQSKLKCQNLDEFKLVKSSHVRMYDNLEAGWMEGKPYAWMQQDKVYLGNCDPNDWEGEPLMITMIPNVRGVSNDTIVGVGANVYEDFMTMVTNKVIFQKNVKEDKVKDLNDEQQQ